MSPGEFSPAGTATPYTTAFDGDLQFFTPFEDSGFGDVQAEPVGWFLSYDRLYWNVSPPEQSQKGDGDFGWGNRYNIGYMTPENNGWMVDLVDMNGPNLPLNSSEMSGFAFERMYELQLANGTFLTPNFAIRYVNIIDRTLSTSDPGFGTVTSAGTAPPTKNNIIGGQFGLGWHMRRGPWRVSTNSKLFVAQNFQVFNYYVRNANNQLVDGPGFSKKEFVPAGELQLDLDYSLTRDIAVNVGWDLLYFAKGIARQQQDRANNENMMYTGIGLGIVFNR